MLHIYTTTYPMSKMVQAADIFLDLMANDPYPDYVKIRDLYAAWGGDGVQMWTIYEVADDKEKEGIASITKRLARFASVEGFRMESRVILPLEEALAVLGKKLPS